VVTCARREKLVRSWHLQNWKRCSSPGISKHGHPIFQSLPSLLWGYEPRNVYIAEETGLFFNVLPDRTLVYKGESCHGGKHSKDRLNVLLCVNSDGSDKQVPIVIGKSPKPRCFKNVKKLPTKYHVNGKAWLTTDFLFVPPFFRRAKQTNYSFCRQLCSASQRYILS